MTFLRSKLMLLAIAVFAFSAIAAKAQSGENRVVRVINEASSPIYHLYVSNVDQENWGPDQLGLFESIDSDHYMTFNMDDGSGHCLFDIKAVLRDGRTAVTRRLNVCTMDTWTVYNN